MFKHYAGNNYQATKTQRVDVNINAAGTLSQSRYYFPDLPELNKQYVVGISAHIRYGQTEDTFADGDINGSAPNGYQYWGSFDSLTPSDITPLYTMLNMINSNKEKVIENFPCYQLFNAQYPNRHTPPQQNVTTNWGQFTGRIMPITGYFLIRECYLYVPNSASTPNNNVTASFTFYHL